VNPAAGSAYVLDRFPQLDSKLWLIHEATDSLTPVNLSFTYPDGIAVDPATGCTYITDSMFDQVDVFRGSAVCSVTVIALGATQSGVAVNPSNGLVYTADANDQVAVIGEAASAVTRTVPVASGPAAIAVDTTTGKVFVANAGSGTVSVLPG